MAVSHRRRCQNAVQLPFPKRGPILRPLAKVEKNLDGVGASESEFWEVTSGVMPPTVGSKDSRLVIAAEV